MKSKVFPKTIKGKFNLPNRTVEIGKDAVANSGTYTPANIIINNLKKASKENIFPPVELVLNNNDRI